MTQAPVRVSILGKLRVGDRIPPHAENFFAPADFLRHVHGDTADEASTTAGRAPFIASLIFAPEETTR